MTLAAASWTTDPPKESGWYWVWYKQAPTSPIPGERMRLEIAHVIFYSAGEDPVIDRAGSDWPHNFAEFTHWRGPLPEPGLPE